jgi:ribonucleoside-diphosphate reductase alpha chain
MANRPYQKDRFKYKEGNQTDIYNPEFESAVKANSDEEVTKFQSMMDKMVYFASYFRWFPDLFLDMMTPPECPFRLNLYQRVLLRCLFRFRSTYTVVTRGASKTFTQLLALYLMAIFYPSIKLSVTAETKEQAVSIFKDKHTELTTQWFPFLQDEIKEFQFAKDTAHVLFQNGSRIDVIANQQSSKGLRRNRGNIEESARLNNELFKDVIEPIYNIPRRTMAGVTDPRELHGQINFFTTAGFKGTDEYIRSLNMLNDMANLNGKFVFGAGWELPVHFGLMTKKWVLDIQNDETTSPIAFAQNFMSIWVGAGEGALVNMDKVQALRFPELKPMFKTNGKDEFVIAMDVARSQSQNNNQSAFVVGKIVRSKNGNIRYVDIVNIIIPPNGLNFREQTVILKRLQKIYNAKAVVVDANGVGKGIVDECLHETEDRETGEMFDCWDCMNLDLKPDIVGSPKILYGLNATGINNDIIVNFWDYIESGKVRFLVNERNAKVDPKAEDSEKIAIMTAHMNTDKLMEELSNLKVEKPDGAKAFKVKQITRKIDKDIYSALVYLLYYIQNNENVKGNASNNYLDYLFYN